MAGRRASARLMFPLAAASIVGVRSHDRRPEEGPDDGLGALGPSVGAALMARRSVVFHVEVPDGPDAGKKKKEKS